MIFMNRRGMIFTILMLMLGLSHAAAQVFTDIDWGIFERDSILPRYRCSVPLEEDFACFKYSADIEYPEFVPMNDSEIAHYGLNKQSDTLPEWPHVTASVGVSAKQGVLDVEFTPIVFLDGRYQKITSFKLVTKKSVDEKSLARGMQLPATRSSSRYAENSVLATGKWVKIRVPKSGVYKITKSELSKMGFTNPSKVRLFGYGGHILPETNIASIADDLQEIPLWRNKSNLLFYANGTIKWKYQSNAFVHEQNCYSQYSYYFLNQEDGAEPKAFPKNESLSAAGITYTTFPDYTLYEKEEYSLCAFGRVLLDGYDYSSGRTKHYKFSLPGAASVRARVAVSFASNAVAASSVGVYVDEKQIGTLSLGAASSTEKGKIVSANYMTNSAIGEEVTVSLKHNVTSNSLNGFLDYICINYTRNLALYGAFTNFRGSTYNGNANFKIATNNSDVKVWCVTTPSEIAEYSGTYSDGYYTVTAPGSYNEEFVAVDVNANFPSVEVVGKVPNQNLHSLGQTDMVIIVPSNGLFLSQAERLAQMHRETDSLTVAVVTADQVYNEFSSGTPDATAYRRLMKMLYDRAASPDEAPKYLLLLGDACADNRLITNKKNLQENFLLCYQSQNSVSATDSYVLEDYFAFLDDSEGASHMTDKVDISVGRIPARSLSELTPVVDKIINYAKNAEAGSWQNNIVLLADDGDPKNPNSHMRDAENIASIVKNNFPSFMLRRIYWDDYPMVALATGNSYPAVTAAIKEQLNDGALIVNYSGHGSANLMSHEMAWKAANMAECTSPRLPLWVTASCDISPFDIGDGSIGEEAILNPVGAAVALFTTTRTVYQTHNLLINQQFIRNVLARDGKGRASTIGDAVRKSKVALISGASDLTANKLQYILLGDPALRLKVPEYEVVIDRFAGKDADVQSMASAGDKLYVEGHIRNIKGEKAEEFNGVVSPTMFDYEQENITKDNTGLGTFTYHAHKNKLYSGSDSVIAGSFKLTIPVPMDISYSDEAGLLSLYAVTHDGKSSAQGRYDNFIVGGTSSEISDDKKGPEIKMYLNKPSFRDGDEVNAAPCLFVELSDAGGINTVGSGIGHDIVAIVDNDPSYTFNLNGSFVSSVGDYASGRIVFPLASLPAGEHTLLLRAWDLLNNSSTATINFTVVPDLAPDFVELNATPNPVHSGETVTFMLTHDRPQSEITVTIELFDFQGRILWSNTENAVSNGTVYTYTWDVTAAGGQPIPTGVYLYRAKISAAGGSEQTKTRKIVILDNK